jgi:hypothetical protein
MHMSDARIDILNALTIHTIRGGTSRTVYIQNKTWPGPIFQTPIAMEVHLPPTTDISWTAIHTAVNSKKRTLTQADVREENVAALVAINAFTNYTFSAYGA